MSPERRWIDRIQDLLEAIAEIEASHKEWILTRSRWILKTSKAVEWNFTVIGEAATQIPEEIVAAHAKIPWHLIRAMRNRFVHVYFDVDPQIVWDTIQNNLPPLAESLAKLLEEE